VLPRVTTLLAAPVAILTNSAKASSAIFMVPLPALIFIPPVEVVISMPPLPDWTTD
jgi:hypothetical protein